MTILGAIFAGGAARRFGGEKASALIAGRPMIEHVAERLRGQCDALVVVGRAWPGFETAPDAPMPGLGPLGALAGAMCHARAKGHDLVLTSGCDLPDLPMDLAARLAPAPAVVRGQPLLGLWQGGSADELLAWLTGDGDRAMRSWIAHAHARQEDFGTALSNINTREEMDRYLAGLPSG